MNILKFSLIAILLVCSSNALFTGTISNIISTGVNAINGAIVGGQFVWDNAINPALQVLQQSKIRVIIKYYKFYFIFILDSIDFIDNHFGNLLAGIGKRTLTTKVQVKNEFLVCLIYFKLKNLILKILTSKLKAETNEYFASLKKLFLGYVAQVKFQLSILYPVIFLNSVKNLKFLTQIKLKDFR